MKKRINPVGPMLGSFRVFRGGGWLNLCQGCRSAFRVNDDPSHRNDRVGFRVVAVKRSRNGEKA